MGIYQIGLTDILTASNYNIFLGIPFDKIMPLERPDGTRTDFRLPERYRPIYPISAGSFKARKNDIIVHKYNPRTKEKIGDPLPVKEIIFQTYNLDVPVSLPIGFKLENAPAPATADLDICVAGAEEFQPQIAQNMDTDFKQETKEIAAMGTDFKLKSYGSIDKTIKSELIMNNSTLALVQRVFYSPSDNQEGVEEGLERRTLVGRPRKLYARMPVTARDLKTILGMVYVSGVTINPDFATGKAGETEMKYNLEMSVGGDFNVITKKDTQSQDEVQNILGDKVMKSASKVKATA